MKFRCSLWAFFFLCASASRAAVSNNTFLARAILPNDPPNGESFGSFDKTSKDPGEPAHADQDAAIETIWWSWTAPADGVLTMSGGANEPHVLAVYTGTQLHKLMRVAYDVCPIYWANAASVTFNVKAGVPYQIAAARAPNSPSSPVPQRFRLGWAFTTASSSSNDAYAGRIRLDGNYTTGLGVNTAATKEPGELNHADNEGGKSLWWIWTARRDRALVTVSTKGSHTYDSSTGKNRPVDTLLTAYITEYGPLSPLSNLRSLKSLASNQNADGQSVHSEVKFHAVFQGNYAFAVDGARDSSGHVDSGNVVLTVRTERSNDNFADRALIPTRSARITGTNIGLNSGKEAPASSCNTVWWTWRAPANGTVKLSTAGSSFDTRLEVFTGASLANLVAVASSDDVDPDATPPVLTSQVEFAVSSGTSYQIAVGAKYVATGVIMLDLNFAADFPAIVAQPVDQNVSVGSSATFSVAATGKPLPTFLWQRRPVGTKTWLPLNKETSPTLTLADLPQSAHGDSFRCEVSNSLGKVVSAIATLRVTPPAPAITLPDALRIRGSVDISSAPEGATDDLRYYASSLPPGLTMDPITGRISGTITKAGTFTVTYWSQVGKVKSALQKITFVVLPIPATMTGSFEGLLVSGPEGTAQPAGKLSIKITNAGAFTGALVTTDAKAFAIKGVLALNDDFSAGSASLVVKRSTTASYTLDLGISSGAVLFAELREGDALKSAFANGVNLPAYTAKSSSPGVGTYTATLRATPSNDGNVRPYPHGTGYATASIATAGTLTLRGKLADGVMLTASLPRGADAAYRFYLKPYKTPGSSLAGVLPFVARADEPALQHAASNDVYSLKSAQAKDAAFPAGFGPLKVAVSMEPWRKVASLGDFFDLPSAGANHEIAVLVDEAGISNLPPNPHALPTHLLITSANAFLAPMPNPSAWSTKVNLATGAFAGGFRVQDPHPLNGKTVARTVRFEGVLQQVPTDATYPILGSGFFLAPPVVKGEPTLSGTIDFAPPASF